VRSSEVPVVLDADGLNAFAGRAEDLADRKADLILTPHAGEFARVAGVSTGEVAADRVRHVRELAARTVGHGAPEGQSNADRRTRRVGPDQPDRGPFLRPAGRATCSPG
jgi:hypothetical protein